MPAPFLVKFPVPLAAPLNSVLEPLPPAVSVPLPSDTAPSPASEPTVSLLLAKSNVPDAPTVSAEPLGMRSLNPMRSVPALTVVSPA